ncbi:histidine phosphatase family protein [Rhodococcus sp. O3]|uniref:histidine phosphatase family protein n=1 Tax=Rhodococcus sp. O3 TaxID=3404919 RepID=UPI003B66F491
MQLLLIRHALPVHSRVTEGRADPALAEEGHVQAARLPEALSPYRIRRIFSSPQRRALETAAPLAVERDLPVEQIGDLAEYDYDLDHYIPFDDARELAPAAFERIRAGLLPEFVDEEAFRTRVLRGVDRIVGTCAHEDTVAVFAHGGVVNAVLQNILGLARPLEFPIEYTSVTRVLVSRNGARRAASINETGHVRDLLRV